MPSGADSNENETSWNICHRKSGIEMIESAVLTKTRFRQSRYSSACYRTRCKNANLYYFNENSMKLIGWICCMVKIISYSEAFSAWLKLKSSCGWAVHAKKDFSVLAFFSRNFCSSGENCFEVRMYENCFGSF